MAWHFLFPSKAIRLCRDPIWGSENNDDSKRINGRTRGQPTYRQPSSETMFRILLRAHSHLTGLSDRVLMRTLLFLAFVHCMRTL